jgi:hypothetical protein
MLSYTTSSPVAIPCPAEQVIVSPFTPVAALKVHASAPEPVSFCVPLVAGPTWIGLSFVCSWTAYSETTWT